MFFLPLNHDLRGADCLVIGGGTTALRKIQWLLKAEAKVRIVAPAFSDQVHSLAGRCVLIHAAFEPGHVQNDTRLIIAATDDPVVNAQAFVVAQNKNILINCVDDPARCTVTFPAIVDRSPVLVSISTSGRAPALARIVRGWIEEIMPATLGRLAEWVGEKRDELKVSLTQVDERVQFWDRFITREAALQDRNELESRFERELNKTLLKGTVSLVGAGPGDPELLTLKALRAIQSADVILYDKLANGALLDFARRDAEVIDVGKQGPKPHESPQRANNRGAQQSSINAALVALASKGLRVVRLKGGDPFLYGRGGEEIEALAGEGIPFQVIPGITASLGAASYAGIPLTHRDLSQSVRFVTGHRVENTVNLDWPEFAKPNQTLVIYMGLVGLPTISARLIEHGALSSRPVLVVENATLENQRIIEGTLETIASLVEESQITGPSIAIIGEVVSLRRFSGANRN